MMKRNSFAQFADILQILIVRQCSCAHFGSKNNNQHSYGIGRACGTSDREGEMITLTYETANRSSRHTPFI